MPYIQKQDRKKLLSNGLKDLALELNDASTPGDLNYIFTVLALAYLKAKGEKYQHYNDLVGALEGCKLELYRVYTGKYEQVKMTSNGPVEDELGFLN